MIEVIGNEYCSRCTIVKNVLNNKGIEFNYYLLDELSSDRRKEVLKMARESGNMNMPLVIKNNEIVDFKTL